MTALVTIRSVGNDDANVPQSTLANCKSGLKYAVVIPPETVRAKSYAAAQKGSGSVCALTYNNNGVLGMS